jgi:hypothetical protein
VVVPPDPDAVRRHVSPSSSTQTVACPSAGTSLGDPCTRPRRTVVVWLVDQLKLAGDRPSPQPRSKLTANESITGAGGAVVLVVVGAVVGAAVLGGVVGGAAVVGGVTGTSVDGTAVVVVVGAVLLVDADEDDDELGSVELLEAEPDEASDSTSPPSTAASRKSPPSLTKVNAAAADRSTSEIPIATTSSVFEASERQGGSVSYPTSDSAPRGRTSSRCLMWRPAP